MSRYSSLNLLCFLFVWIFNDLLNYYLFLFFSDLLKMNEELTKERDRLLTSVGSLRDKLNKATATQQDMEAQRQSALQNISQVS